MLHTKGLFVEYKSILLHVVENQSDDNPTIWIYGETRGNVS